MRTINAFLIVQLMTGRYNIRNYLNFGTLVRTETTFGHLFRNAGYATGICGKWQLGREVDSPQHFGFEESCLWQHTRRPRRYANPESTLDQFEDARPRDLDQQVEESTDQRKPAGRKKKKAECRCSRRYDQSGRRSRADAGAA